MVSGVRASVLLIGLTEVCSPYNQLTGPLPSAIGNLANLITLDLESNQLRYAITNPHMSHRIRQGLHQTRTWSDARTRVTLSV